MVGWHHPLNGNEFEKFWEIVKDREAWHAAVHRVAKSWAQLKSLNNIITAPPHPEKKKTL